MDTNHRVQQCALSSAISAGKVLNIFVMADIVSLIMNKNASGCRPASQSYIDYVRSSYVKISTATLAQVSGGRSNRRHNGLTHFFGKCRARMRKGHSSSDDEGSNFPTGGSGTHRRGWVGEELEIEHRREQLRREADVAFPYAKDNDAAVDLRQFQNTEVGKGYQAKFVVRQKSRDQESIEIKDMTGAGTKRKSVEDDSQQVPTSKDSRNSQREKGKRSRKDTRKENRDEDVEKYLKCTGLRMFCQEIEKILHDS